MICSYRLWLCITILLLFIRLRTPKKRVIADRQVEVLKLLMKHEQIEWLKLAKMAEDIHRSLANPMKALVRDINYLAALGAVIVWKDKKEQIQIKINLD